MSEAKVVNPEAVLSLQQRRAFMKLPLDERRRQLSEQADQVAPFYTVKDEEAVRHEWQGGDVAEC